MDGLQVLDAMRARPQLGDLPVIVISGHGDIETAVLAVKKGAYDYLPKPLDSDRVLVSVRNALRLRQLATENTALRRQLVQNAMPAVSVVRACSPSWRACVSATSWASPIGPPQAIESRDAANIAGRWTLRNCFMDCLL
jgi:DNA-binding NtrC family response regulator